MLTKEPSMHQTSKDTTKTECLRQELWSIHLPAELAAFPYELFHRPGAECA